MSLREEIAQTKPLSLSDELLANLHRTSAMLLHAACLPLARRDLTGTQYNILRILRGAGKEGRTCGEIAARLVSPDPDVTRLLDRLERRRLVSRTRDPHDRRVMRIRITARGQKLMNELMPQVAQIQDSQISALSAAEVRKLIVLLEKLRGDRHAITKK